MNKIKLATVWLDGCAGCHMSLLDIDEGILAVGAKADLVYGPLVDAHEFPSEVDVTLVEGAVATAEDVRMLEKIRARTRLLVALGDCAVTSNVPSLRNAIPVGRVMHRVYIEGAQANPGVPSNGVPALLAQARPLHDFVKIDLHLPGCPPKPQAIFAVVSDLLAGKAPKVPANVKFG